MNLRVEKLYGGSASRKAILAPMVRAGTLPLRLLSVAHGADTVYTEEIIDHKMLKSKRVLSDGGFVDYILNDDPKKIVFRTCSLEKEKLVFQVGTSDAARAVKVAEMLGDDISGFDINMGCPKPFSVKGGMGAALLRSPEVAEDILKSLRRNITHIPITCKIRLLESDEATVELARRLEAAGAQAIGVHMRETHHRPRDPAIWERLKPVVDAVTVPIIANGDIYSMKDAEIIMERSGASGVMFARGALRNPSVFNSGGPLPLFDVMRQYTRICKIVDNVLSNSVYTMNQMLRYEIDHCDRSKAFDLVVKKPKVQYEDLLGAFQLKEEECTLPVGREINWETLGFSNIQISDHAKERETADGDDKKRELEDRSDSNEPSSKKPSHEVLT